MIPADQEDCVICSGAEDQGGEQREREDRDGHAVHSKVTKTEDAGPIGDDGNAGVAEAGPAAEDFANVALVFDGNELERDEGRT